MKTKKAELTEAELRQAHRRHAARQRRERNKARQRILKAANKRVGYSSDRHLGMRNLQEAVMIVRRFRLVKDETLVKAGFNPIPKPVPNPSMADRYRLRRERRARRREAALARARRERVARSSVG